MSTTTFNPTLLQKLLGRNYKWWYMLSYFFKARTTYRFDNLFFASGQLLIIIGTILTWSVASEKSIFDPSFSQNLTYFVVGGVFTSFVYQWPSFYGFMIKNGNITADLLRPQNFFSLVFCRYYGVAMFQNITLLFLILLISPIWIWNIQSSTVEQILLFIICIPIAIVIQFFTEISIAFLAFFVTEINGITLNYGFIYNLFTGKLFPLHLLIPFFFIHIFNPYSYLFYHPMQIYLGEYDSIQTGWTLLGGVAWCVVLYFLAKLVFRLGLKRNESVGL